MTEVLHPEEHLGLARQLAHRAVPGWLSPEEREDALGDAYLGLVDGCRRWKAARGLAPSTYLAYRIRGAIVDGHRARNGRLNPKAHAAAEALPANLATPSPERVCLVRALLALPWILTRSERAVLRQLYFEGMLLREIAALRGVTESRVCQIHRSALAKLRRHVAPHLAGAA